MTPPNVIEVFRSYIGQSKQMAFYYIYYTSPLILYNYILI
jgi:hypothetical protein